MNKDKKKYSGKLKQKEQELYLQPHRRVQSCNNVVLVTSSKGLATSTYEREDKNLGFKK